MGSMGGRTGLANWQLLFLLEGLPSIWSAIESSFSHCSL